MTGSYLLYNELHYNGLMADLGLSPIIYSKLSALPKYLSSNNTLFIIKRHVVYNKTSRCLPQNDTSFTTKRAVVLIKSIHHGHQHTYH